MFIPEDVDLDDNEAVTPYLKRWLMLRFNVVIREMSRSMETSAGGIVVKRAINVPKRTARRIASTDCALGEFWSFGEGQAFWGDKDEEELHMQALVAHSAIDWATTIKRNMNYVLGDEESEVFLRSGTPLKLIRLEYGEDELPIKISQRRA